MRSDIIGRVVPVIDFFMLRFSVVAGNALVEAIERNTYKEGAESAERAEEGLRSHPAQILPTR